MRTCASSSEGGKHGRNHGGGNGGGNINSLTTEASIGDQPHGGIHALPETAPRRVGPVGINLKSCGYRGGLCNVGAPQHLAPAPVGATNGPGGATSRGACRFRGAACRASDRCCRDPRAHCLPRLNLRQLWWVCRVLPCAARRWNRPLLIISLSRVSVCVGVVSVL